MKAFWQIIKGTVLIGIILVLTCVGLFLFLIAPWLKVLFTSPEPKPNTGPYHEAPLTKMCDGTQHKLYVELNGLQLHVPRNLKPKFTVILNDGSPLQEFYKESDSLPCDSKEVVKARSVQGPETYLAVPSENNKRLTTYHEFVSEIEDTRKMGYSVAQENGIEKIQDPNKDHAFVVLPIELSSSDNNAPVVAHCRLGTRIFCRFSYLSKQGVYVSKKYREFSLDLHSALDEYNKTETGLKNMEVR